MFKTSTGVNFEIYINDVLLPLNLSNVESLLIVNNIYDRLPSIRLTLIDDKNIFNSMIQLYDGCKIGINIGNRTDTKVNKTKEDDLAYSLIFSLISSPTFELHTGYTKVVLYGILNFLPYWQDRSPIAISGSSNDTIKTIMQNYGIKYKGTKTYDNMIWHNFGKSRADFVKDITNRSFVKDGSCMLSFFRYDGTFNLINVNSFKDVDYTLVNTGSTVDDDKSYYFTDINYRYNAGINDFTYTYKTKSYQHSFMKNNDAIEIDNNNKNTKLQDKENNLIKLTKTFAEIPNINEDDYSNINVCNNFIDSINVGNVHQNWTKAYYQNMRYRSMFNIYCEVYLPYISQIDIGDKVEIKIDSGNKDISNAYGFNYWFVEAKTLGLSVNQYTEKLLLSTTGFSSLIWKKPKSNGFVEMKEG